jgi:predicted transposase/invertase (TIGR01784 family)
MDPAIKKVHERIKYVEQDENMLHAYRMHEMAIYDFNTSVSVSKIEGIEIGEKRGIEIGEKRGIEIGEKRGIEIGEKRIKEKQIKTVKRLRDRNFSIKDIAETMDITEQEVYNILNK